VASYITGARLTKPNPLPDNALVIDENMQETPGEIVLVFERTDSGKKVKAIFRVC